MNERAVLRLIRDLHLLEKGCRLSAFEVDTARWQELVALSVCSDLITLLYYVPFRIIGTPSVLGLLVPNDCPDGDLTKFNARGYVDLNAQSTVTILAAISVRFGLLLASLWVYSMPARRYNFLLQRVGLTAKRVLRKMRGWANKRNKHDFLFQVRSLPPFPLVYAFHLSPTLTKTSSLLYPGHIPRTTRKRSRIDSISSVQETARVCGVRYSIRRRIAGGSR